MKQTFYDNHPLTLTPKKICTAVKTIAENKKDERSRNVVIYGISKSDGEKLENKVASRAKSGMQRMSMKFFMR